MPPSPTPPHSQEPAPGPAGTGPILDWLAHPVADNPIDELEPLRKHLGDLSEKPPAPVQLHKILDLLHDRALATANLLIPRLFHVRLPISPATRRTTRTLQEIFELLAHSYIETLEGLDERLVKGLRRPQDLTVWQAMYLLNRHLFISNLISAPPTPGIWRLLHRAMVTARRLRVHQQTPDGTDCSVQVLYKRTLLTGCAQSSAFTAHEWSSIDQYVTAHGAQLRIVDLPSGATATTGFWSDAEEDMGPVASSRRPPPERPSIVQFECDELIALLDTHLEQIRSGRRPSEFGLPEDLPGRLARALLHRLRNIWGEPRKRRFPRRRQGYRAHLCFGFEQTWNMLRGNDPAANDPSQWMVTNESPDGYAAMHVAGKLHKVQIGDMIALRAENSADWQIGVVRWALSENPEHLELGLQVIAPRALPASLALPTNDAPEARQPVLLMPAVPPLRDRQSMATLPGLLAEGSGKLLVVVESGKVEVREIRIAAIEEQSPDIDVFAIDPDRSL